jgi:hypothetical protein
MNRVGVVDGSCVKPVVDVRQDKGEGLPGDAVGEGDGNLKDLREPAIASRQVQWITVPVSPLDGVLEETVAGHIESGNELESAGPEAFNQTEAMPGGSPSLPADEKIGGRVTCGAVPVQGEGNRSLLAEYETEHGVIHKAVGAHAVQRNEDQLDLFQGFDGHGCGDELRDAADDASALIDVSKHVVPAPLPHGGCLPLHQTGHHEGRPVTGEDILEGLDSDSRKRLPKPNHDLLRGEGSKARGRHWLSGPQSRKVGKDARREPRTVAAFSVLDDGVIIVAGALSFAGSFMTILPPRLQSEARQRFESHDRPDETVERGG